ncbi:thioredoxin-like protein 4A isoform X2 [Vespa velutina]|uniref:thioredoxin-like protein 4A isoform X2 n=1 Tax=Vespa velutina TaxID=202808 RepID=UPI001FB29340|nr:thioredoxin-like protein 4A isoform X2 [Vespa velutina]
MSYMLSHLHNGWQVDQAILSEEDRVVVIRFGHDWDPTCMKMDEVLYNIAEKVKNFAVIYLVDITEVPDFNKMTHSNRLVASADGTTEYDTMCFFKSLPGVSRATPIKLVKNSVTTLNGRPAPLWNCTCTPNCP